jgi:hypothetical protein
VQSSQKVQCFWGENLVESFLRLREQFDSVGGHLMSLESIGNGDGDGASRSGAVRVGAGAVPVRVPI